MKILKQNLTNESLNAAMDEFFKGTITLPGIRAEILKDIGVLRSRDSFIGIEYTQDVFQALLTNRGPTIYYNKLTAKPVASVKLKSDDLTVQTALNLRICRDATNACMSVMPFLKGPIQDMVILDNNGEIIMELKGVNVTVIMSYLFLMNLI